jgi:hypothetical protein
MRCVVSFYNAGVVVVHLEVVELGPGANPAEHTTTTPALW